MLSSDHPGERSAALAAHRLVKMAGCSWRELLSPTKVAPPPARPRCFADIFHDPLAAANSHVQQLRRENEALRRDLERLKRDLRARRTEGASPRQARGWSADRHAGSRRERKCS